MPERELDPADARARAVGNAVYLEHIGGNGDIASWGCESRERAEFIAGQINAMVNGLRSSLADSARVAGEYAHEMSGRLKWWQGVAEAKQEERDAALKEVGDLRAAFAKMGECPTAWADMCAIEEDHARLRAGLEMLAQIRSVSGNAQPAFRSQLRTIDAILAGADVRDLAVVEAIAAGTWKPTEEGHAH